MKVINATTIGILISAHMEGDEAKFLSYATVATGAIALPATIADNSES